ncbi:hypothetical protein C2857_004522 [Epichloe festucae Fl1]|uniref:NAD(P)-binding protein n=1 Tax=Epichloe festucae (strain Fl1) TaxID=877507 RepID=A0A7S9KV10_EPIFF|nr:hypothetical protein C2857_004522 [Epichloe festucae Fl1]
MTRSLVVIGSGPGIGVHVASHFASKGFSKIALLARSTGQLERDSAAVRSDHGHVDVRAYPVDVTDSAGLRAALGRITDDLGPPEVVFFNAARVKPSLLLEVGDEEMLYDFKISAVALHQTAKWAIPHLTKLAKQDSSAKPSLLVTSSHLPQSPEPDVFVLSLTKAAQRNLAESLAKVYQPQGVHVGLVIVAGSVAPEKTVLSPRNIAKKTYELFAQEKGGWTLETYLEE